MQIEFDLNQLGYWDIKSMSEVMASLYRDVPTLDREIMTMGFNTGTGYAYIVLENQIQICSAMGDRAEFLVCDYDTGEETFCETYDEAFELTTTYDPERDEE